MKVVHKPEIDYLSIDFMEGVEAKSYFEHGILVREDADGHVIGIDITDSTSLLIGSQTLSLQEACKLLQISESTMRRKIREGKIKYTKPNQKDYCFKKKDILQLIA